MEPTQSSGGTNTILIVLLIIIVLVGGYFLFLRQAPKDTNDLNVKVELPGGSSQGGTTGN